MSDRKMVYQLTYHIAALPFAVSQGQSRLDLRASESSADENTRKGKHLLNILHIESYYNNVMSYR